MVDARIPERFLLDRRFMRLEADAFRDYVVALVWSVSNRTDGAIDRDDLSLIPGFRGQHAARFVDLGLWEAQGRSSWLIVDFRATQTSANDLEVLERIRAADRDKKRRQRAEAAETATRPKPSKSVESHSVPGTVPGTDPRDVSPGTAQDRDRASARARARARASAQDSDRQQPSDPIHIGPDGLTPAQAEHIARTSWKDTA